MSIIWLVVWLLSSTPAVANWWLLSLVVCLALDGVVVVVHDGDWPDPW